MNELLEERRILAEDNKYKVYSVYESVYLIDKYNQNKSHKFIAWIYGDPKGAIISKDQKYIVVSGYGISIYYLDEQLGESQLSFFDDPDNSKYTCGLHQNEIDDKSLNFFRFVSYNDKQEPRVFRMNAHNFQWEEL